ncbi:unnamed protein product, partial [Didymodactylos carnosus]
MAASCDVTVVCDDYTARSQNELSVTKGQHVRILQRTAGNSPEWCLIRLLNDHSQQIQQSISGPSSLASSTTISGTEQSSLPSVHSTPTKYVEGLVPSSILKATKSNLSVIIPKTEQDASETNNDDSHQQQSPALFTKRKTSIRRILKNPVRRLSLKDGKDAKNRDIKKVSTTVNLTPIANSTSKIKAFTFTNSEDLQSASITLSNTTDISTEIIPPMTDENNSTEKTLNGMNGSYKISDITQDDDDVLPEVEVPPPMEIQQQPIKFVDNEVNTGLGAPISIVAGLPVNDFQIPAALNITNPVSITTTTAATITTTVPASNTNVPSTPSSSSLSSSPSNTAIPNSVISNDEERTPPSSASAGAQALPFSSSLSTTVDLSSDNPSLPDIDAPNESSSNPILDEAVDDKTKYGEKR